MDIKRNKYVLRKTNEGKVLFIGVCMALVFLAILGFVFSTDPAKAKSLFAAFVASTFGGRAAGIGICIEAGFSKKLSIIYNFYLELLIVFFTYSFFVMSIKNYITSRTIKYAVIKVMRKAYKHEAKIQKYGWLGLFAFVMLPLPVTGPVVGSMIGYLLRFRILKNFSAVFLGTLTAIAVWVFLFGFLEEQLQVIRYILIAIVGIVIISYIRTIIGWLRKRK